MGTLIYGNAGFSVDFDDRTLVHLQLVIGPKLRRQESFFFTWSNGVESGHGRTSLWMDRSVPMIFQCVDDTRYDINREWLELLSIAANSAQGLQLVAEPEIVGEAPGLHPPLHTTPARTATARRQVSGGGGLAA
jgi:hypothetical protein